MLGAIVGDIVGSIYEHNNIKTKDFLLFGEECRFTDDTVMTIATADALLHGGKEDNFIDAYKKWGRMYPTAGYGVKFSRWILSSNREPYYSWGNGSAMRVSPCGWVLDCGFWARTGCYPVNGREIAARSARVTHNHPEGIKGAVAVADAICHARFFSNGYAFDHSDAWTLDELKRRIRTDIAREHGYDLDQPLNEIRSAYQFDVSCQGTVPQAIIAFLESTDFEDAIRNAISLGGDSDTLAAITGSIAEAAYGIPEWIKEKALCYLTDPMLDLYQEWEKVNAFERSNFEEIQSCLN